MWILFLLITVSSSFCLGSCDLIMMGANLTYRLMELEITISKI